MPAPAIFFLPGSGLDGSDLYIIKLQEEVHRSAVGLELVRRNAMSGQVF